MADNLMHRAGGRRALDLDQMQGGGLKIEDIVLMKINNSCAGIPTIMAKGEHTWRSRISCCRLSASPSAAAIAAIDKCVAVAGDIGARVTAMAVEEDILVRPKVTISTDLDNTAAVEAVRSVSDAHGLLKAFDAAAIRFGVRNEQRLEPGCRGGYSSEFCAYARGSRICRSCRSSRMTINRKRSSSG